MSAGGPPAQLELLALGRSSVDLYGQQVGGRLEDMASFAKYVGGSPTNTAIGASRLGLRAGLITRVGADHMGRFIREQLVREGVDIRGVVSDPDRLTALAILGIRDPETFPLVFYRENCADMALCEADIDPAFVGGAGALLINGTHLSRPSVRAASLKAIEAVKSGGGRIVFDVDYRPVLWGLADRDNGEDRFVANSAVTDELQAVLPLCDLVVGTEEEIHILGGSIDTHEALCAIRSRSGALIVLKRGADGCVAFESDIPQILTDGIVGRGFPIEVFNVLGAGDAFMAGFLRGWLRDLPLAQCCTLANACGALVVSRHGCAPAEPSWEELELFLSRSGWPARLRDSLELEQIHWSTNRTSKREELAVFAIDHRSQFAELVESLGADNLDRVPALKALALRAVEQVADGDPRFGLLLDDTYGARALDQASGRPYWLGRPIELPGSRPIRFEGAADVATTIASWPTDHVVKCLIFYHPDDPADLAAEQDRQIERLFDACRATRHELLLEVIASRHGPIGADTVARVIDHIYDLGVYPDWWKLEPSDDRAAWTAIERTIAKRDPHCRGVVLLGLSAPPHELLASFAATAPIGIVKGFAVGRTIWQEPSARWLAGEMNDAEVIDAFASNFRVLVDGWRAARKEAAA